VTTKGIDFSGWTSATAAMPWGVQRAFMTALETVRDGQIKMVWGADSYNGSPCLVNAINQMIHSDAQASPMQFASDVVGNFDKVNRALYETYGEAAGFDSQYVTVASAEVLIHHFGTLKPEPDFSTPEDITPKVYVEKSDTEMAQEWLDANKGLAADEPCEIADSTSPDFMAQIDKFIEAIAEKE